jgi:hypothetical protein
MGLDYLSIFNNSLLAGVTAVVATQVIFFIIARIFNYDFVFPIETGRIWLNLSEDFYTDTYAGIRGFLIHLGIGMVIMIAYSFVFVHLIAIFFDLGPYTYEIPSGTAILENLFWIEILGLILYFAFYIRDKNFDKFSVYLFFYLITMVTIMGVIFGLYLIGKPGIIDF